MIDDAEVVRLIEILLFTFQRLLPREQRRASSFTSYLMSGFIQDSSDEEEQLAPPQIMPKPKAKRIIRESEDDEEDDDEDDGIDDDDEDNIVTTGKARPAREKSKRAPAKGKGKTKGFSWEETYERSWDVVREEGGTLEGVVNDMLLGSSRTKRFVDHRLC